MVPLYSFFVVGVGTGNVIGFLLFSFGWLEALIYGTTI